MKKLTFYKVYSNAKKTWAGTFKTKKAAEKQLKKLDDSFAIITITVLKATPSKMRSKIAQEILDEMEPKHSDLVREYGALWLENDQQAIQIKALKEQLQAAAESLRLHKELVEAVEAFLKREVKDGEMDTGAIILSDILTKIKSNN